MELKGHLLYYPEGKHDINLDDYVQKSQLNDALKSKIDPITKTTYADLKNLRDNSKLVPGALYRITDYNCTTTQENTQSAGHQFDIVLLALSEDKLAEEGWAMEHEFNMTEYEYNLTDNNNVTGKVYAVIDEVSCHVMTTDMVKAIMFAKEDATIDEVNKTIVMLEGMGVTFDDMFPIEHSPEVPQHFPNFYFQNSNLSAWKVWYCLDNDKSRFAWADDSVDEGIAATLMDTNNRLYTRKQEQDFTDLNHSLYAWIRETDSRIYYTETEQLQVNDWLLDAFGEQANKITSVTPAEAGTGLPNGRGVIYRLIDEWNNDCPYDFKNIQYKTKLDNDGFYNISGDDSWTYSLNCYDVDNSICYDASIICATLVVSDMTLDCYDNFISCAIGDRKFVLQHNQIFTNYSFDDKITNSAYYIKMFGSSNARIGFSSNVGVYGCSSFDMEYEGSAIYINNKKVLTES